MVAFEKRDEVCRAGPSFGGAEVGTEKAGRKSGLGSDQVKMASGLPGAAGLPRPESEPGIDGEFRPKSRDSAEKAANFRERTIQGPLVIPVPGGRLFCHAGGLCRFA